MGWDMKAKAKIGLKDQLGFGKHAGDTFADVMDDDPEYISWCMENVDDFEGRLTDEALEAIAEAGL